VGLKIIVIIMLLESVILFYNYHVRCADGIKRLTCSGSVRIMQIIIIITTTMFMVLSS